MEDDKEMLEDLVAAAVNDAVRRVEEQNKSKMGELTGGMQLPRASRCPSKDTARIRFPSLRMTV
jgi:hypothetical protein